MITRAMLVAWLTLVWVLLWGEPSVGNVAAGVVLGVLIVSVFPPADERGGGLHPVAVLSFGWWFAKALVMANLSVAKEVLRPRLALEEGIVAVPLRSRSPLVATFVANAITLTPGTLTVDVRPEGFGVDEHGDVVEGEVAPVLYVHCLVTGDPDTVRAESLELEERVVRAFGTAADRAAVLGTGGAS